jgi:hypothetical protein
MLKFKGRKKDMVMTNAKPTKPIAVPGGRKHLI